MLHCWVALLSIRYTVVQTSIRYTVVQTLNRTKRKRLPRKHPSLASKEIVIEFLRFTALFFDRDSLELVCY